MYVEDCSYNDSVCENICKDCQTNHKANVGFGAKDSVPLHGEMPCRPRRLVMRWVLPGVVYRGLIQYRRMKEME
jgi:hypothetical protein